MSWLYWVHKDEFAEERCHSPWGDDFRTDPIIRRHGYIGVSENPTVRWHSLRQAKIVPKTAKLQLLFEGTREQCLALERTLRPRKNIGWNTARGGSAAEPLIRGRTPITGKVEGAWEKWPFYVLRNGKLWQEAFFASKPPRFANVDEADEWLIANNIDGVVLGSPPPRLASDAIVWSMKLERGQWG